MVVLQAHPWRLRPFYFAADDGTSGNELWKSDGTETGTTRVRDISAGVHSSSPNGIVTFGGASYFQASDDVHGFELWKTDGTETGTVMVKDINPGTATDHSMPEGFVVFNCAWRWTTCVCTSEGRVPCVENVNLRAADIGKYIVGN